MGIPRVGVWYSSGFLAEHQVPFMQVYQGSLRVAFCLVALAGAPNTSKPIDPEMLVIARFLLHSSFLGGLESQEAVLTGECTPSTRRMHLPSYSYSLQPILWKVNACLYFQGMHCYWHGVGWARAGTSS